MSDGKQDMRLNTPSLDNQLFQEAMHYPDLLGKMLRMAIEIDVQMNTVIETFTPVRINDGMGFDLKCTILSAIGVPKYHVDLARKFARLRNILAHNKLMSVVDKVATAKRAILEEYDHSKVASTFPAGTIPDTGVVEIYVHKGGDWVPYSKMDDETKLVLAAQTLATSLAYIATAFDFVGLQKRPAPPTIGESN